jgi:hypothetical protein
LVAVQSGEELQVGVSQAGEYSVRYQDTDGKVCNQRVVLKAGRVVTLQLKQLRKLEAVQLSVAA